MTEKPTAVNDYKGHAIQLLQLLALLVGIGALLFTAGRRDAAIDTNARDIATLKEITQDLATLASRAVRNEADIAKIEERLLRLEQRQ